MSCFLEGDTLYVLKRHTLSIHTNTFSGPSHLDTCAHRVHINTEPHSRPRKLFVTAVHGWWMAYMIATRSPLCLTFLKYSWHSPRGAPCLPPSQALCWISQPWKNCYSVVKWFTWLSHRKPELIGIQEKTPALPVSSTFPVWEDHCASRESSNAIAADE